MSDLLSPDPLGPHAFWDTQPVPRLDEVVETSGPVEIRTSEQVDVHPVKLPEAYEWYACDLGDNRDVDALYALLNQNYVEDGEASFRFDYSREFLKWALTPPGYVREWHLVVRAVASKKFFGFISGIPALVNVEEKQIKMAEINFLCVHKKLRSHRLGPVLIREITRRVNLNGIWQAVYTSGTLLPKPIAENRYFHRSLNPKKLIDIGFSRLPPKTTLTTQIKLHKMPTEPKFRFRKTLLSDVSSLAILMSSYLAKFKVRAHFSEEDVAHWILPHDKVVYSYVIEKDGTITDLISFYELPSSILKNPNYSTLRAAYSYYQIATSVSLKELFADAFTFAQIEGFDVFNALDVMENGDIVMDRNLRFGPGDGHLKYYLYNWKLPMMKPGEMGLVLL